jgi:hypothetical protein
MIGQAASNGAMTAGRTLPWLQDTLPDNVWTNWGVTYRDFRIIDSQNRLAAVYNLTEHDLANAFNRAALTQLLLQAAQSVDSTGTGLPDDWRLQYFQSLAITPQIDTDGDGLDNFTEFAFGTNPMDPGSSRPLLAWISGNDAERVLNLRFRRRAGSILDYVIQFSPDPAHWTTSDGAALHLVESPKNLFDGTGTSEVAYAFAAPGGSGAPGFVRVRAVPRSAR